MSVGPELKIFPFLVVNDALNAVDFYIKAFGAAEQERFTNQGRTVSRISIGQSEFWIGDEEPEFDNLSPLTIGASPVRIVLTTPNPEAIFASALEYGATQMCPVTVEESWKIGKLKDPYGHIWEIGCPVEDILQ